jgi:hypothetical protein
MLYNWSGAAYRSKQVDVAAVEVEEVLEMIVTHDRDGGIVFGRDKIDGIPIHKTEGFADAGEMQRWFAKVIPVGKTFELALMRFRLLNVKEHATLSARASVDDGVEVECRKGHENRAADRGCVSRLVRLLGFLVDAVSMKFCP